ncbi:MAG: IclR family transcriptional regulator [Desulfobacteraceae bacterium]|nr:IclR family transcriptional regulator [Desulfobacteraceae bacterium]
MGKKYQAPIVKKAFTILRAVANSGQGLRISEISTQLDISKSTVHGITSALEDQGAIIRDSVSKKYTVGMTLMELGRIAFERIDFKKAARPVMEELMEACQESVFLGIRNGSRVTVVDIVESRKDFKITSPIGTAIPLTAGATGKIFLSMMEDHDIKKFLNEQPLKTYTVKTITSNNRYLEELKKVKTNGFATDDEEYISGVRAVAAPLKGYGLYSCAIWVVGFKAGLNKSKIQIIAEQTVRAADKISQKLNRGS